MIVPGEVKDDAKLAIQQPKLHEEDEDRVSDNVRIARRVVIARGAVETADFGHVLPNNEVEEPVFDVGDFGVIPHEGVLAEEKGLGFGTDLAVQLEDLG